MVTRIGLHDGQGIHMCHNEMGRFGEDVDVVIGLIVTKFGRAYAITQGYIYRIFSLTFL